MARLYYAGQAMIMVIISRSNRRPAGISGSDMWSLAAQCVLVRQPKDL